MILNLESKVVTPDDCSIAQVSGKATDKDDFEHHTAPEQTYLILSSFASAFETPVSLFYLSFPDLYSRLRFRFLLTNDCSI